MAIATLPPMAHIAAMRVILRQMRYTRASWPLVDRLEKHLDDLEKSLREQEETHG